MLRKLFCTAIALLSTTSYASQENLHWRYKNMIAYHNSGAYTTDFKQVTQNAQQYLSRRLQQPHADKLAVIFDIDETALSNFNTIKKLWSMSENVGDRFSKADLNALNDTFNDPAIQPTLHLYRYALQHHVTVFFVTGRYESDRKGTAENLRHAGYKKWKQLILRQPNQYTLPADLYKTQAAKSIKQQGYDIVFSIGDQYSDLPHQYVDACFKAPNPFYYIA